MSFEFVSDGVNPVEVPFRKTYLGNDIPALGVGTFGSDHVTAKDMASAVREALALGYRHIDCASVYGNEAEIGKVFAEVLRSGRISREEMWVTGKLWNDMHGPGDVLVSVARTLRDLQLDYLDLYLVHWPFPNHHDPGVDVNARHNDSRPYVHKDYIKVWQQMERLVDAGLVRHIGTSNMTVPKLNALLAECRIRPAANEMELHPHFQQPQLFDLCLENGIIPIGYSPLGSPNRPDRDKAPGDTVDMEDPVIVAAARAHGVHPASICLKWAVQRGQVPIPMSTKRKNLLSNLKAVSEDPLTDSEMAAIAGIDRNCRLVKGQVFLWQGAESWEDLWDIDGKLPGTVD